MPNNTELKQRIDQQIQSFAQRPLRQTALSLFSALGYTSDRTVETRSVQDFREQFDPENLLSNPAAQVEQWHNVEFLFQLTDEELSSNAALFKDDSVRTSLLQSYVFIAIELREGDYARGKLANIARQINRIFPMPVMVLFKVGGLLSFAVINRRQNKRDENKDVLGKVTLIQNIAIGKPHPGHLDILATFSLTELSKDKRSIQNFDQLHAAWEDVFNVELLNKRFYRELANWYFWALPQVDFPADIEKDDEKRRATGLIRLLTRLIFCWFLKEKSLVPDKLFVESDLKNILKDLSPDASTYNEAILQNLFFATLNQRMGKDAQGQPFRVFAKDEGFQKNRVTYGVDTLFRYEEHFQDPDTALDHFADVPFLNGGLFECLDRIEEGTNKKLYLDGFSRNAKKRPTIPNRLFFGSEHEEDLSVAYGDIKRKKEKVRGLLRILHAYKFTIVENTPVDQEIALDPELLGKVFENLLASYNEETKTTARKQTGSFYTPRPIVDYMVDESLKAHLTGALAKAGMSEKDAQAALDILFTYTERAHPFSEQEVATLLDAIHTCKILDPACGSGAFPMGMLHKLVYIIHKLDPDNARWKQLQVDAAAKIPDLSAREAAIAAIERDFADNENDYGRKLYLIENCLYGVDIQPIAIQISKLRFFISLVCDQRTNRNKRDNHGIRPLPNLETKFVAANTLIGLPEMNQWALLPHRVYQIEAEIEDLHHRHFAVQRRDQKLALQKKIKGLREELGRLLGESLGSSKKAQLIADWDAFNPQAVADFFDPHWMFGKSMSAGCDIVIGNPPYLKERDSKHIFDVITRTPWGDKYHEGKMDYWYFFLHRAFDITKQKGVVAFITSRYWINSAGSKKLIRRIRENAFLFHVVDIGSLPVFEVVAGHHMLHFYRVGQQQEVCRVKRLSNSLDDVALTVQSDSLHISEQIPDLLINDAEEIRLYESTIQLSSKKAVGDFFDVSQGVVQNPDKVSAVMSKRYGFQRGDGVFVLEEDEFRRLRLNVKEQGFVKSFYDESSISRFHLSRDKAKYLFYITKKNCPSLDGMSNIERHLMSFRPIMDARRETVNGSIEWFQLHWPRDPRYFESAKVVLPSMFRTPAAAFVPEEAYFGLGSNVVIGGQGFFTLKILTALLNSSVGAWWFLTNSKKRGVGVDVGVDRLRQFPLPDFTSRLEVIETLVELVISGTSLNPVQDADTALQFFDDLIDACVMECYFHEHMAERDLLFLDELAPHFAAYNPNAPEWQQREFTVQLLGKLNAPSSTIRNRLLRISADSPDLLAVIKEGGKA
jgi:adenine-specific DNA-methyltransferase